MKKEKKVREWIFLAEGDLKTAEDVNLQDMRLKQDILMNSIFLLLKRQKNL
jgi:hypothetical protein